MKKKFYILAFLLLSCSVAVWAQVQVQVQTRTQVQAQTQGQAQVQTKTPYKGEVHVDFPGHTADGELVTFYADVDFSEIELRLREMIELTPVLRSTETDYEMRFSPVVISGRRRARVIERAEAFGDYTYTEEPAEVIILKKKTERNYQVAVTLPFEKWMRHSELVVVETCSACCNLLQEYAKDITSITHAGEPYVFPEPYRPHYTVLYITPEVESVKLRNDSYAARLNFQVNKSVLLRNFGNNAAILDEADQIVSKLMKDPLLSITAVTVTGYASPEGSIANNQKLSDNRAKAFVDYLAHTHNLQQDRVRISSRGMGEDWAGLRKVVEKASYLDRQQAVLDAIDNIGDKLRLKTVIKGLNGGSVWHSLLTDFFPPLRRNEYTIEYTVRSFNEKEAFEVYQERPELLSLNELFMVSSRYDKSSKEFKEVFDVAVRLYPESDVARLNAGAMALENGSYPDAIQRLEALESPQAWNNLGIAYWHKEEYEKASEYFQKAADAGLEAAQENLKQYNLWLEDR